MDPGYQSPLLSSFEKASSSLLENVSSLNEEERKLALRTVNAMAAKLQKPEEAIMRYAFELGSQRMAIRTAIDLGIFTAIKNKLGGPISAAELAEQSNAEEQLIVRIMRVLAAIGWVSEDGHSVYRANSITNMMCEPPMEGAIITCYDLSSRIQMTMHEYLKEHGYKSPFDEYDCAFQWTFQTKQGYFEYVHADPRRKKAFNDFMGMIRSTRHHWTEWYPVQTEILKDISDDGKEIVLIDLGGGKGHDVEAFLQRFPSTEGRLMLQDLPATIPAPGSFADRIKILPHNFFEPQPVIGARVYYTHFVMHDWPDQRVRDILQAIMPAMKPGYSKVLLNEVVLPDTGCPPWFAAADINMMTILAGMERTQKQWQELVESVGLQVTNIRVSPFEADMEGIIEAMLPPTSS